MGYRNLPSHIKAIMGGFRGITTQGLIDARVKRGTLFYVNAAWPLADTVGAGETVYVSIETGALPVEAISRIVSYVGEEFALRVYAGGSVTGGEVLAPSNYNSLNPATSTVTIRKNPNIGSLGTAATAEAEYYFGAANTPNRVANSIPAGRSKQLAANTTYIVAITNNANNSVGRIQYYLDWYEGEPDLPDD